MAFHHISGDQVSGLGIAASGDTWLVDQGVSVTSNTQIAVTMSGDNTRLAFDGFASGSDFGLAIIGANNDVVLGVSSQVSGDMVAVLIAGMNTQLDNKGIVGAFGNGTHALSISGDGTKFVNNGSVLVTGSQSTAMDNDGDNTLLNNLGSMTSGGTTIFSTGDNFTLDNRGSINGESDTIYSSGNHFALNNYGKVESNGWALSLDTGNVSIFNAKGASISGTVGIFLNNNDEAPTHFTNLGSLSGTSAFYGGDGIDTVINKGAIDGDIFLREGNDVFVARNGVWTGASIDLGDGNDTIDTRGGTFHATAFPYLLGGNGNDTFVVDRKISFIANSNNAGLDSVRSTVTQSLASHDTLENLALIGKKSVNGTGNAADNVIDGNSGKNVLVGMGGEDVIDGGKGVDTLGFNPAASSGVVVDLLGSTAIDGSGQCSLISNIENLRGTNFGDTLQGDNGKNRIIGLACNDILVGNGAADTFAFFGKFGDDTIADFSGRDRIDLSKGANAFDDFGDLMSHATISGNDLVITLGQNSITLTGIDKSDLNAADFLF